MSVDAAGKVLLVEDNPAFRAALADSFTIAGLDVELHGDGQSALASLSAAPPGVVVTDLRMPRLDGNELFEAILARDRELPVILMTGHGDIAMAVDALKHGAFDFLAKPFMTDHLIASVRRALEMRRLVLENRRLRQGALEVDEDIPLVGQTPTIAQVRNTIRQIAKADVNVLIEGETGTGKEFVARLLHRGSARRGKPFVSVDCAALSDTLVDETLLGTRLRRGLIAEAHRGTLFLDGIESMSPLLQGRLMGVAENKEVPGANGEPSPVDLRIIAAAKRSPVAGSAEGAVRPDLLYHLDAVRIRLPPLRERRADIGLLFRLFLDEAARRYGVPSPPVDAAIERRLLTDEWLGNVRELRNFATQIALGLSNGLSPSKTDGASNLCLNEQMDTFEAGILTSALRRLDGDVGAVAEELQLPRRSLYARLQRLGIHPAEHRRRRS
ncbi:MULTISPECIES: sigma-54-dependent transcriptional regulator [unclassified Aureimonas]|uniref:sigma-54-dependent transcriptional regulator n=1 Tax=unclassified Aureimonas TaxID=2615206 RepID=UPI0006FA52ED|nr:MULTISPECIES: sigma-54 dependent transcriptional regulator [unclassified Aureimonas]KQT56904.1 Fis family transcriptional regulator [Aureimonas sp. Leaf427]KQT60209.1 Fis family transcriptional regulator [Aureimonas sp. Leaf460]